MGREYKITAKPLREAELFRMLQRLPSPIQRSRMREIYNFRVEDDGYYLIDHLVDRSVAAEALLVFIDAALSTQQTLTISEP